MYPGNIGFLRQKFGSAAFIFETEILTSTNYISLEREFNSE